MSHLIIMNENNPRCDQIYFWWQWSNKAIKSLNKWTDGMNEPINNNIRFAICDVRCAYLFPIIMTLMVVLSVIIMAFICCCYCFFLHCFYLKIKGTSPDRRISSSVSSVFFQAYCVLNVSLVWYYYDTNTHTHTLNSIP